VAPVATPADAATLAPRLLRWAQAHGRHDLPWQQDPTPYRVWISEVMLQQTQVATVIPYYQRFTSNFPTIAALAAAELDEVLHVWTGLGYYARARNLHRAARIVMERHEGRLPEDLATLQTLPGIGRSTAGAVLALSRTRRHPILDGNARRVLARYFGVEGHIGEPAVLRRLWALAEACTPSEDVAAYTQAIMDLGSLVCTRVRPTCPACPLRDGCVAYATDRQAALPAPRPRRLRSHRRAVALLVVRTDGAVLLEERPPRGLWGGLAGLPMFPSEGEALAWCIHLELDATDRSSLPDYEHAFTHFDLTLSPLVLRVDATLPAPPGHRWYDPAHPARIGLSKPAVDLIAAVGAQGRL
jgi:A/G-specific adenine glycosylase